MGFLLGYFPNWLLIGLPVDILVSPLRSVERFADLTVEEVSDLFVCVHRIAPVLQRLHSAPSLTIAVQDGEHAGQTVPHVHVHMLPRKHGDFPHNDDIYNQVCDGTCPCDKVLCIVIRIRYVYCDKDKVCVL